jgi:hypothetical protein
MSANTRYRVMKQKILVVFLITTSTLCCAAEPEKPEWSTAKLVTVALSAEAIAIWGAYKLGDTTEDSQDNVKTLVGIQLGWFLGLLYEGSQRKSPESLSVVLNRDHLALYYAF